MEQLDYRYSTVSYFLFSNNTQVCDLHFFPPNQAWLKASYWHMDFFLFRGMTLFLLQTISFCNDALEFKI